ncbi:site-specific integrase [Clostridia bacterium OttesenSCG-928-F22]|nr:site-specific integrase [Clostridia bacterium OttesenSCG-928-F22]
MAQARKRGDGYQLRVYCGLDNTPKRQKIEKHRMWYPEPGMTPKQIEKELERQKILFEEEVRQGKCYDENMTFAQLVEIWDSDYAKKQLAPKTYIRYQDYLRRILPAIGHIKLKALTPIHLNRFYENLGEEGINKKPLRDKNGKPIGKTKLAEKTIGDHHKLISKVLSLAVQWGLVESNVASRATPPKVPYKEMKYLNEEETKQLIHLLDSEPIQYRTMILMLIHTGMRRGELMGLEWKDIDFENQTVRIARTSQYVGEFITKEPKTRSGIRVLTLNNTTCRLLKEYRAWQNGEKLKLGDRWIDTDRLFTKWNGEAIYPETISQWFRKFIKRSGLPYVTLHSLRHTNATLMIAENVDIPTVSKRLGHANTSTTLNVYTHALEARDKIASEKLESILS